MTFGFSHFYPAFAISFSFRFLPGPGIIVEMSINTDIETRLQVLGDAARDDACASPWSEQQPPPRRKISPIPSHLRSSLYLSLLPGGRKVRLFKTLLDNRCLFDCRYCGLRTSADSRRCRLTPEELARIFFELYEKRAVDGLFLSSAIPEKPDRVQERMIATVEILRRRYRYRSYIHLKILPGVSEEAVRQACRWADRVSVNLEAPNQKRLSAIAPRKNLREGAVKRLEWASLIAGKTGRLPAGITTQFVVGASGETDGEILKASDWLYRKLGLRRAYYSAFRPVAGTPLEYAPPPDPRREQRLYQSDWLIREYGFACGELPFDPVTGNLPLETDPKLAWTGLHPAFFPVEINEACREELLRVPGLGRVSVERIIRTRRRGKFRTLEDLKNLRVPLGRTRNFVTLDGRYFPLTRKSPPAAERQLFLEL